MIKLILAASLLAVPAMAQSAHGTPMTGMSMAPAAPASADPPSTAAYRQAMKAMMEKMDTPFSGNADHDFVAGMLPHHQGAIDMARVELQYGRDPALKKLARDIIASQAKEQVFMRNWLARHPLVASKP
jgi:uncharacterized protein (DUF305 family)